MVMDFKTLADAEQKYWELQNASNKRLSLFYDGDLKSWIVEETD